MYIKICFSLFFFFGSKVCALDRFGDFVADHVAAPVRDTCAQALGAVVKHLPEEEVSSIVSLLMRFHDGKHTIVICKITPPPSLPLILSLTHLKIFYILILLYIYIYLALCSIKILSK